MSSPENGDSNPPQHARGVDQPLDAKDAGPRSASSYSESAEDYLIAFDVELELLRGRILTLTCTIAAQNYIAAWSAKQDIVSLIDRVKQHVEKIPEGLAREDAMRRLSGVLEVADQMFARAPSPSPAAIRQARSTNWKADRSIWEREEQEWLAALQASAGSAGSPIQLPHQPTSSPGTPPNLHLLRPLDVATPDVPETSHEVKAPPPDTFEASHEVSASPSDTFDVAEALQSLHREVMQLEAMANAASEAVTQLPSPSGREERRVFERVHTLVAKIADETIAVVRYGDELIAALALHLKKSRPVEDRTPGKASPTRLDQP